METNPQPFPFGQKGTILSGEHPGWSIEIVDDTAETGGYFIYIQDPNPDYPDFMGFDWWLENASHIPGLIEEMDWQIQWPAATEV
ncbi:hypothetical protein [Hymenobacter sp. UYCo722]|uniref:hypothetical protein n=1 Tax=Hymenobacter sp. UYCo722 TaxID=3156335 RepID=UPI00339583B9